MVVGDSLHVARSSSLGDFQTMARFKVIVVLLGSLFLPGGLILNGLRSLRVGVSIRVAFRLARSIDVGFSQDLARFRSVGFSIQLARFLRLVGSSKMARSPDLGVSSGLARSIAMGGSY